MALHALMLVTAALMAGDTPEEDKAKFQGTWAAVLVEREGVKLSEDRVGEIKVVIEGDRYGLIRGDSTQAGTFKLDPSKRPKAIDITPAEGKTTLGIYTIEGDIHKVCFVEYGGERPTDFSTEPESGRSLYVMRRVKP